MELKTYITEKINIAKKESLKESIRPMVAEALNEAMIETNKKPRYAQTSKDKKGKISVDALVKKLMSNEKFKKKAMAYLTDDDAYNGWSDSLKGKTYDTLDNMSDGSKRRNVTQKLKDEKIDCAPLAYKLWPSMSKDAARSWFYKKLDGKNESFTDEEISTLYGLLNNKI